jgi:hypothetical protein
MGTLIDHFSSDRVQGGRLVIAYVVGGVFGVALALAALLAAGTTP